MESALTHLILNSFHVEAETIVVRATDNERWLWDVEDGYSGADAWSFVFVELKINEKGQVISEQACFHCNPDDPVRELALSCVKELFDVAWSIKNEKLDLQTTRKRFFGMEVKKSNLSLLDNNL